ncbi:MAG: hypothetical protein GY853_01725 [PVC group bacterium]|nr:hypothetical protein [PVC group bacterium]
MNGYQEPCPKCGTLSSGCSVFTNGAISQDFCKCPECGIAFPKKGSTAKVEIIDDEEFFSVPKPEKFSLKEICICAAVKAVDGTIIRGHRHRDCRDGIIRRGKEPMKEWAGDGFITSYGRFVDRIEGYELMKSIDWESVNPEGYQKCEWLFSEDLY